MKYLVFYSENNTPVMSSFDTLKEAQEYADRINRNGYLVWIVKGEVERKYFIN